MKKIKILHVVGDPIGGIRKHVHDILNCLHKEFDFVYISSNAGDTVFCSEIHELSEKIENYYSLNIKKKPAIGDVYNIIKIYKLIKLHGIDVVHGHGAKGGLYARIAGKLAGCKVIYTPHGGVVHSMFKPLASMLYKIIEKCLCFLTDFLIFESHYTANSFSKRFGCKKVKKIVNYNGVQIFPMITFEKKITPVSLTKKIGVFGVMREEKGQDIAYEAVKNIVLEDHIGVELHFFGGGPLKKQLKDRSVNEGVAGQMFFHGEVSNVYEKMVSMDFILIPSRFESFGYVAVEAALLGVPIISSKVGGLNEVLYDEGCFFSESTCVEGLKKVILKAIYFPQESKQVMIENARNRALKLFSLDRMSAQLSLTYKMLIASGKK